MPFPLAHPAAVLPLRRFCPRYFSFPALIIGSLTPDAGYAFGSLNVENFSHRLLAGNFGFCLPMGLVFVLGFYLVRSPVVHLLPALYQRAFLPLCQRPVGPLWSIVVSLLIGAWTHQLLDALTHPEFWLVQYMPDLLARVLSVGSHRFLLCEVLYAGCTFSGVAWLVMVYLRWWESAAGTAIRPRIRWGCALSLAGAILLIALACRSADRLTAFMGAGIAFVLMVIGILLVTGWGFSRPRRHE
jgi:hypothetical protein